MSTLVNSDYRDEFYVSMLRCRAIIEQLAYDKKGAKVLTIQKAALVDHAIKNPSVIKRILSAVQSSKRVGVEIPEILYPDNTDYGDTLSPKSLLPFVLLLQEKDLIEIEHIEGLYYLTPATENKLAEEALPLHWLSSISLMRQHITRPLSTLQKSVLREDI